jgi:hypothetical protein
LRRALAVWLALFATYAATMGLPALDGSRLDAQERAWLAGAQTIVDGGAGGLDAAPGVGFPLLLAPAYALGGEAGAQLLVAALAALGFALAVPWAQRVVPEPWATRAVLVAGLSPPALAHGASVHPEPVAGALLAGAALLALAVRERSRLRHA